MCDNNSEGGDRSTSLAVDYISDHNEPECLLECEDEEMYDKDLGENLSNDSSTEDDHKIFFSDLAEPKAKNQHKSEHYCDFCEYSTPRRDHLRRHMFRHKEKQNLPMFNCDKCDYQTPRKDHLKKHAIRHKAAHEIKKLKCPHCDYEIVRTDHMKNHIVTKHKDQLRMLKCANCAFETPHEDVLKRHILRHANKDGAGEFKCEVEGCDYFTNAKKHLTRHQYRKHNLKQRPQKSKENKQLSPEST